ncbi:MAG: IS1595 family transposase [Armatimonadetes bacterium]|nr:IS1595 family transposase [Armatimonadota bacterium]
MNSTNLPKTLMEAMRYFSDDQIAFEFVKSLRWGDDVICPHCGGKEHSFLSTRRIWKCKACKKQFSVKIGTIFEDSPISLDKWLAAIWLIANAKNGISSYEIHRSLGVTQKTAWFMLHRIREALHNGTIDKLSGEIEADETYIGGKAKNMHQWRREQRGGLGGSFGKTTVLGMLERGGSVKAEVIQKPDRPTVTKLLTKSIMRGSKLYTDQHNGYDFMKYHYEHEVIHHAQEYVRGNVHTNGIENFWSLLKRTISGTYVSVEPTHLFRYVGEQVFRFNERKGTDSDRFLKAVSCIVGKKLPYKELTGKVLATGAIA